ncbi:GSCFA domain-containing protein [Aequorivita todarodis]|uniref:GSCFA domain-containing protein n=1 Tax=Aequorivita todarodis TaxID=2036821 RepID=UPI002350BF9C|nr:GSCFA domain-containing protein [Aequorivita todarodis]MDC8001076.1 GSCFA domain-containing protein [Aequorivita todarodis]
MKLQTEIPLNPEENQIDYSSKILLMGSCFSENIGRKFDYFKFQNLQNPFGVIFNPVSIEKLIVRAIDDVSFSEEDIFQHNEVWKCFEAHSELSALDMDEFLVNLNSALQNLREALFSATHIIFTFGTSWVYRTVDASAPLSDRASALLSTGEIVANCHKLPKQHFQKELLSIETISKSLQTIFDKISTINPTATIINTVSPVRHIKDGFAENSLSKAHLISAIHHFLNLKSAPDSFRDVNRKSFYFPAFEIMMDELRDYRFYAEDLLHPNSTAIELIWQKFSKVWIAAETETLQKEIASIQNGLNHRSLNPESAEHLRFLANLQQKISSLKNLFPHIQF